MVGTENSEMGWARVTGWRGQDKDVLRPDCGGPVAAGGGMWKSGGNRGSFGMDLGIRGKRALVTAGSKGLGRGCAEALAAAGVDLVLNARGVEALEATAAAIRAAHGVKVEVVAGDITQEAARDAVLRAAEGVDILVTNAGGPPPGLWSDWGRDDFQRAIEANMLTPIFLMQALLPGMIDRSWGRVVNITSQSVKSPIPALGLSNMARAGLTGFVGGTARQVAGRGVTINNLLPGIHDTDRAAQLDGGRAEVRAAREASIPAGRYGTAAEFGAMCAFLCSQHAGYIVGQNILLDGGSMNSTL
jgi:3-oxoacyl-[acyl-carrier protein] reductase